MDPLFNSNGVCHLVLLHILAVPGISRKPDMGSDENY